MNIFKKIYNYRELLKTNVKKEIRGRYKNSILGVMWSFLNPLLQLAVYSIRGFTCRRRFNILYIYMCGFNPMDIFHNSNNTVFIYHNRKCGHYKKGLFS